MNLRNKRILITCGPTWVPIDSVRVISNRSTGQMGHLIAKECHRLGARVTLIEGPVIDSLVIKGIKVVKFHFFKELEKAIRDELKKKYDFVFHAAAVSDYALKNPSNAKLSSGKKKMRIDLEPTRKIINNIKRWNKDVSLIGFKLEPRITQKIIEEDIKDLFTKAKCDYVIANALAKDSYSASIIDPNLNSTSKAKSRLTIVKQLLNLL